MVEKLVVVVVVHIHILIRFKCNSTEKACSAPTFLLYLSLVCASTTIFFVMLDYLIRMRLVYTIVQIIHIMYSSLHTIFTKIFLLPILMLDCQQSSVGELFAIGEVLHCMCASGWPIHTVSVYAAWIEMDGWNKHKSSHEHTNLSSFAFLLANGSYTSRHSACVYLLYVFSRSSLFSKEKKKVFLFSHFSSLYHIHT